VLAEASAGQKHGEILKHLKTAHALSHGYANMVAHSALQEGMKVAKAKGRLRGKQPKLNRKQEAHLVSLVHSGRVQHRRSRRTIRCRPLHRLPSHRTPTRRREGWPRPGTS